MASHGAKNFDLPFTIRRESDEDQTFFQELSMAGCSVQCFPSDVADRVAVKHAIDQASMPIAGFCKWQWS